MVATDFIAGERSQKPLACSRIVSHDARILATRSSSVDTRGLTNKTREVTPIKNLSRGRSGDCGG